MSTDGVELFRKGKKHQVWPIILQCYNLAPQLRFQEDNIICSGVIPGPCKPKDIDSFLYPTIRDLKILHNGVDAYNGATNSHFTLRAHVVTVTADMPARDMLMGLAGYNSRHYCNYCTIRGCSGYKSTYVGHSDNGDDFDMSATADADDEPEKRRRDQEDVDMPDKFDSKEKGIQPESQHQQHQRRGTHMYCPLKPPCDVPRHPDWRDYNPRNLPLRVHCEEEQTAGYFVNTVDSTDGPAAVNVPDESFHRDSGRSKAQLSQITHATGIQKRSSLWDLPSLIWPW
jgi:hypothetical protein